MAKKKKPAIADLIKDEPDMGLALNRRYPPEKVDAYVADLKFLVEQERAGKMMPSLRRIVDHMADVHDMITYDQTIGRHLGKLRRGKEIWQRSDQPLGTPPPKNSSTRRSRQ